MVHLPKMLMIIKLLADPQNDVLLIIHFNIYYFSLYLRLFLESNRLVLRLLVGWILDI